MTVPVELRRAAHEWLDAYLEAHWDRLASQAPVVKPVLKPKDPEPRALADRALAGELIKRSDYPAALWRRARLSAMGVVAAKHDKLRRSDPSGARAWLSEQQHWIKLVFDAKPANSLFLPRLPL
jgi:hypothetical protein